MISIMAAALLDAAVGDPYWLPHPVRLIGKFITLFERAFYAACKSEEAQKLAGVGLTIATVVLAYGVTYSILWLALRMSPWTYHVVNILLMYSCIAAKCLSNEAFKIFKLLQGEDMEAARQQTSMIVGRDTDKLEGSELARAVVETVAENSSDGVIAPLFYMAIGGAPLAMAYKAVNTLDSMVGYKSDRYINFGRCAARLDDAVNYVPARLTALLIAVAAFCMKLDDNGSIRTIIRDGKNHSSPNSGYPEAAVAGALGIMLGGTNLYFGKTVHKPTIGDCNKQIERQDILAAVALMRGAYLLALCSIAAVSALGRWIL